MLRACFVASRLLVFLFMSANQVHSTLIRRAFHSSALVGNYIYVDGGERSDIANGNYLTNVETHTLSIPVNVSWSPADVEINVFNKPKDAPVFNDAEIWANPDSTGFYSYGGEISPFSKKSPPPRELWNFTVDGNGGGFWANQTSIAGETFSELVRASGGASDILGTSAYYLGGTASQTSDPSQAGDGNNQRAIAGLVSFNMDTGKWENNTASGYAGIGKSSNGAMLAVPRFGEDGLLVVIGGTSIGASPNVTDGLNAPYMSFENISLFDLSTNSWYSQAATGTIPEDRGNFCVVGIEATDNLTYEIFIYGGFRVTPEQDSTWTITNNQLDEVFVLSLPKFEWIKANYTAKQNRHSHTCHVAGNRQMISIGGIDGANPKIDGLNVTDPFPQAIGIFDLTEMHWTDNFSHDAIAYERPDAVDALYREGSPFPPAWSSPGVEMLFKNGTTSSSMSPSTPSSSSAALPTTSESATKSNSKTSGLAIGAILCGIVSAAVIVTIVTFGALLLWQKRKQNKRQEFSILREQISRPVPIAEMYPQYALAPINKHESLYPYKIDAGSPSCSTEQLHHDDGLPRAM